MKFLEYIYWKVQTYENSEFILRKFIQKRAGYVFTNRYNISCSNQREDYSLFGKKASMISHKLQSDIPFVGLISNGVPWR
jgi:hypothetical protein